jgi:hypothetical protein
LETAVNLFWIDTESNEKLMSTVPAGQSVDFTSYDTQMWTFRLAGNGEFIRTIVITPETREIVSRYESEFHSQYAEEHGFPWINGNQCNRSLAVMSELCLHSVST